MVKIKTSKATLAQLDWLVAKCEGHTNLRENPHRLAGEGEWVMDPPRAEHGPVLLADYAFSTDWSQGGPIIDREKFEPHWLPSQQEWCVYKVQHGTDGFVTAAGFGKTLLAACMRCYVVSKLGDETEAPEGLA